MFESAYTRELIALGYADAQARKQELLEFLQPAHPSGIAPASVRDLLSQQKHSAKAQ